MKLKRKKLGDILVEAKLITPEQLQQALEQKGNQRLGDFLIQQGHITEQQLIEALEVQLGIPHVSLYSYPIDKQAIRLVPKEMARRNVMIPLKKNGDRLVVAMADPLDFYAIDDLRLSTGLHVDTVMATKEEILRAVHKYYELDEAMDELAAVTEEQAGEQEQIVAEDSPVVKLVNQILAAGVQQKASDIHIDPQETGVLIRYRVDGMLRTERTMPKHVQRMLTARIKIMANMDITESRIPQDGRIKTTVDFHPVDLRVSTLPTVYGEKIVLRILDLSRTVYDLDKLRFHPKNYESFIKLIERPSGIILITGPTGSGKSSTLYTVLNRLNREEVNIITIEDPVEHHMDGINQIQVNPKVGLTFAAGLRSVLRQDPNIIMVGEIRDTETAEIAIRAALTGHLVLSTIHTNDSVSTISRLFDMGIEPFLIAASLSGIVAQRLVRRVCLHCREEWEPSQREKEIFASRGIQIEKIIRGKGCEVCNMTGYRGRMALQEVLEVDEHMKRMITDNAPLAKIREYAVRRGTIFLLDDGLLKVKEGLTTTEEVLRVAMTE
ncbi:type II secretion system protein E [Caldalkalibacillus thermarum TA2.A1]|uniref:Type II secretion system protein E n=1 Tax=Caldalkalibacillus thermarum (strain TA2.A1) TaxID=986075 RepID=F5LAL7_CALTT|nr:ATPase, T2SS/T4P/T4SS family [Caldalkalibacillus thermarum]EGL81589.1 type II secretion system protein E [Caldalkalibacillus thermarum TA2.A1]